MTSASDMAPEGTASGNDREATAVEIGEQHVSPVDDHPGSHAHAAAAIDIDQDRLPQVQSRSGSHADLNLHELQLLLRTHEEWGAQIDSEGSMPGV